MGPTAPPCRTRPGPRHLGSIGTAATAQLQRPRQQPQREALSALWEIDVNDDEIDSDIAEEIDADFRSGRSHSTHHDGHRRAPPLPNCQGLVG